MDKRASIESNSSGKLKFVIELMLMKEGIAVSRQEEEKRNKDVNQDFC